MNVGVDIIEVDRIAKLVKNRRFLNKVFTTEEVRYCSSRKNANQHFAVRFAAKEAVWKAAGMRKLTHRDISIKNSKDGKPKILLPLGFRKLQKRISISLSHTRNYAVAVALCK